MKYLIIYFSQTGRTKKAAEIIATTLSQNEIQLEQILFQGMPSDLRPTITLRKEDISFNPSIMDLAQYDKVIFGTPVYGAQPAPVFKPFLEQCKNVEGKEWILFATGRIMLGMAFKIMEEEICKKGGKVIKSQYFKGFFKLNYDKVKVFGQSLNTL
jgi:flavodoxin